MPNTQNITVIYITSRGHSGSTLLDLLISGHDQIFSVGEIKLVGTERVEPCGCGAPSYGACPFWQKISTQMRTRYGFGMDGLQLNAADPSIAIDHNQALFHSVAEITGCSIIVDSSKTPSRLRQLMACPELDVRPIHLFREPLGVVHSNYKRGRDWLYHTRNYTSSFFKTLDILKSIPHIEVRYEKLAQQPRHELHRVMQYIGLSLKEEQLNWLNHESHNIGGNPMRFSNCDDIRLDRSWQSGLSLLQKLRILWTTLPARLRSRKLLTFQTRLHLH